MDDYQLTFADYLAIAKRRAWLIALTFAGTLAVGIAVALLIPAVYRSSGTILIESQQIPNDLVKASVTSFAGERIEVIKRRVMTRDNLLGIIRKYELFEQPSARFTASDQVDQMRRLISVELVQADVRPDGGGPATIAFSIAFEHGKPETAKAVADDLVRLFLEENVRVRTQRATQTTEFLTQEAEKLKRDVDEIEARVAKYKQENASALPENVALATTAMQRVEADLRQVERDFASTEDSLRALDADRGAAMMEPAPSQSADPNRAELMRARAELARLSAIYTDIHPDLKAARRKVETLEAVVAAEPSQSAAPRRNAALARIDARAGSLRERQRVLAGQREALRAKLSEMEAALVKAPQVERGLLTLTRDYQSTQKKYEEIMEKKRTAQVAESLEGNQKAERFAVLEPPALPERAERPNRKKLMALAFMVAVAAAAAAAAAIELLQGRVRGVGQIAAAWGQQPLVAVPVLPSSGSAKRRKRGQGWRWLFSSSRAHA
jgi:polysaccharide chain length determinant protein (PEP-CTERM system associated)